MEHLWLNSCHGNREFRLWEFGLFCCLNFNPFLPNIRHIFQSTGVKFGLGILAVTEYVSHHYMNPSRFDIYMTIQSTRFKLSHKNYISYNIAGHQQYRYQLCKINWSASSSSQNFKNLYIINNANRFQWRYMRLRSLKSPAIGCLFNSLFRLTFFNKTSKPHITVP